MNRMLVIVRVMAPVLGLDLLHLVVVGHFEGFGVSGGGRHLLLVPGLLLARGHRPGSRGCNAHPGPRGAHASLSAHFPVCDDDSSGISTVGIDLGEKRARFVTLVVDTDPHLYERRVFMILNG